MWAFPLAFWILVPALVGAGYGYRGYNPVSDPEAVANPLRGLIVLPAFLAAWTVLMALLSSRPQAVRLVVGSAQLVALLLAGAGVCQLAVAATGGWPGGWSGAAVGAFVGILTGAILGVPANLLAARFPITGWLADRDQSAAPGAAPDRRGT